MMWCWFYQWKMEKEIDDHGRIQSARVCNHLKKCPSCRRWLHSITEMQQQLQADSPNLPDAVVHEMHAAILQRLSDAQIDLAANSHNSTHKPSTRYAVAAIAAVVLIAVGLISFFTYQQLEIDKSQKADFVAQLSEQWRNQIPVFTRLSQQPLESELQNLETDIRLAVGFVQDCLPRQLVVAHLPPENLSSTEKTQ